MANFHSSTSNPPQLRPDDYTVGWICAVEIELRAAISMFDVRHAPLHSQGKHDENNYHLGKIGKHNVVICCLPHYGTTEAAIAGKSMKSTFGQLRFGLLVGIGGGIPSSENDIRLGDVVVSQPSGQTGGVVQHDMGRQEVGRFDRIGSLNQPPRLLLNAMNTLQVRRGLGKSLAGMVSEMANDDDDDNDWGYPIHEQDVLFKPAYNHRSGSRMNCSECLKDQHNLEQRNPRRNQSPRCFYGTIASGNSVIRDATVRDALGIKEGALCFETEAAGLMNDFKCIVIRGICNYSDSHSNRSWQHYAASVAAAYAKILLSVIPLEAVEDLTPLKRK